jgi:hypothetical protein
MAVPVPSISCCVLSHYNLLYQIQNALAFNWDTCCHLAVCLQLLPFHCTKLFSGGTDHQASNRLRQDAGGQPGGGGQPEERGAAFRRDPGAQRH